MDNKEADEAAGGQEDQGGSLSTTSRFCYELPKCIISV